MLRCRGSGSFDGALDTVQQGETQSARSRGAVQHYAMS
jgi:hypothetical protein